MPIRSQYKLAREGITADTLSRVLKYSVFNPALTLPLVLLARYTSQGNLLAGEHGTAFKSLKALLAVGALATVSRWLDDKVMNNWTGDRYEWDKEVVVVTGGSDGIGKCVVRLLAERGVKVAVLDVQGLTYEAPPTVHYFHCDLASQDSIKSAAAQIRSQLGDPTVLINNAGVARGKPLLSLTPFDIHLTFSVNTLAHYFLTQEFLPAMIARNHGTIVTVASLAAYVTAPRMVDYAASKAAALAFHEGLAAELSSIYKAPKVRTILMCQGYTRTPLFEGFDTAALYPETVAEEIVKALYRGRSAHLVLPENSWATVPKMRGLPLWVQYAGRAQLVNLMANWSGRQVLQPTEANGEKGKEKGVEESAVLVEGEK